jgi:starch synthase
VHVLFASAELAPVARVGGLAIAAAGLVRALRQLDVDVTVVLPDYSGLPLEHEETIALDVPSWAAPARARAGRLAGVGAITLVDVPGIAKPHPYLGPDGVGWWDNDDRFLAFSAAVAALCRVLEPDVLHLNDWHTASALGFLERRPPTVFTIHNLAYQGRTDPRRLDQLHHQRDAYTYDWDMNPMAGALRLADLVVAVSPTYAREITSDEGGFGLAPVLREKGSALVGILNGIDTGVWNPSTDLSLPQPYSWPDLSGKATARAAVREALKLDESDGLFAVMVTRLTEQKGVDLVLPLAPFMDGLPAQLAVLADGDRVLADALHALTASQLGTVGFEQGYDDRMSHLLFAAGDVLLMPSRFEPCGLAQMQAMAYGTVPVVTAVGGLVDTVVDDDAHPDAGTGFGASEPTSLALLDAVHRAARAHRDPARWRAIQHRGMETDWSWDAPARQQLQHYIRLSGGQR